MTTRTPLRRDLADLKQKVYMLGEKCMEISELYNMLLESYSDKTTTKLTDITNEIKNESKELHEQCFLVLTLQQALIKDLRFVIGSLQVVINLEKITEQYLSSLPLVQDITVIEKEFKNNFLSMARTVQDLFRSSLTSYLSSNVSTLNDLKDGFQEINLIHDLLYKQILNEVAQASGHKAKIEAQLLTTIRSLEKIADLTLNISEQVNYIVEGKS